jgi:hypothetical protein
MMMMRTMTVIQVLDKLVVVAVVAVAGQWKLMLMIMDNLYVALILFVIVLYLF